ncbi:MAG TPA: class III poly(R)-hydroxyalkanoic acid synthase subunit PhaC [Gemmatimonadales bacterium]|nr:class III poly(R)-hydroxyalkanoic acid synthase subunit PhaC [Gemmatimonadales bacterium]
MLPPETFRITPDQAMREMQDFGARLTRGLQTLGDLGEIDVGATAKDVVYREGKMVLYRFRPLARELRRVPVMITYALVNRPYMIDLQEDRSLVRGMLKGGLDVYLIDWGYPDGGDRFLSLDDYINGYMDRCVDVIRRRHALDKINLLGICQGGTFSLCYAALHPEKVRNLITTVTPVDFHTPDNLLSRWVRHLDVDLLVDTLGNIPGELLNWTYLSLKPFRLTGQKYLDMVDQLESPAKAKSFVRMEKWIFDSPDQAGEAFRQFTKDFYQRNALIKGEVSIGGHPVDLTRVAMPVLNIYAADDHLVPPAASRVLGDYVGTDDYTALEFPGGHIGLYVSGKSQATIPPAICRWLSER